MYILRDLCVRSLCDLVYYSYMIFSDFFGNRLAHVTQACFMGSGRIFTKTTPPYGFRDTHYKPKTAWWSSQVYNSSSSIKKTASG